MFNNIKNSCLVTRCLMFLIVVVLILMINQKQMKANEVGYKIDIQIKGLEDTICYMANYYGDKTYLADTSRVDKNGRFVFDGDSTLPGGIYIIAGQSNSRLFEMIIDNEQHFTVTTKTSDVVGNIKFIGSHENTVFFEYINQNIRNHKALEAVNLRKIKNQNNPDSLLIIDAEIDKLKATIQSYKDEIIEKNSGSFVASLLSAMKEPKVDNSVMIENGKPDSVYAYQYYKKHFWDDFDITDDRLLRTPLYHKKLEKYFEKVLYQQPDTITKEADEIIDIARPNKETFKYIIWFLTFKYEASQIMGFDEVFVHMVDHYYANGEAFWADSSIIVSLSDRADALRPILIGTKAPELILIDTTGGFKSLHYSPATYLVVLFYESDCGHCKKEIKELKNWMDSTQVDLQVFAISTDTSLVKWKKFVVDYDLNWINVNGTRSVTKDYHDLYDIRMTPTLFLLDEEKRIIAKRLQSKQLASFLENYAKRENTE